MMMKLVRVLLASILLSGFATVAAAQISGGPCSDTDCAPQNVYVDPNWDQLGTGANVSSCEAGKRSGAAASIASFLPSPDPAKAPLRRANRSHTAPHAIVTARSA